MAGAEFSVRSSGRSRNERAKKSVDAGASAAGVVDLVFFLFLFFFSPGATSIAAWEHRIFMHLFHFSPPIFDSSRRNDGNDGRRRITRYLLEVQNKFYAIRKFLKSFIDFNTEI